jgi:hypothetical protein
VTIVAADHPHGLAVVVGPRYFSTVAVCDDDDAYNLEVLCDGLFADCDGSAPHDCLQDNPEVPGCDQPECCITVCELDPTCCTDLPGQGWQQGCADLALLECQFRPTACDGVSPVYCQIPNLVGSGGHGDNFLISLPSDEESGAVAADNFQAGQNGDIAEVCWWGYFDDDDDDCFLAADDVFQITYYHDDGNGFPLLPEIASFTVNATAVWEGFTHVLPGPPNRTINLYRFSATHTPLSVVEEQCYWLEIRKKNLASPCVWYWEVAEHNLDHDFDYGLWSEYPGTYDVPDTVDMELGWCVNVVLGAVSQCAPPTLAEDCDPPGTVVLTQNNQPDILDPNDSIACGLGGPEGPGWANWYARSYDLSDPVYGVAGQDVWVTCVRFASQDNDGFAYPVTVNLYEDTDGGDPVNPSTDLSLLGSRVVWVPAGARGFLKARFETGIPVAADTVLVVELEAPNRDPAIPPGVADAGFFWPGVHFDATTDSFVRAPGCAVPDYVPISALCPTCDEAQLLQTVHVAFAPPCPCDCEEPPDGTVDVGDFLALLASWGQPGPCDCEVGSDGAVDVGDFLAILAAWGDCPQ